MKIIISRSWPEDPNIYSLFILVVLFMIFLFLLVE